MATVHLCCLPTLLLVLLARLPGVHGEPADSSVAGLVAAACAAFIFLVVVVGMVIVGFTWNNWYPVMQRAKGRVKMPREYWKKKEEAKMRLLNGSRPGSTAANSLAGLPNGASVNRTQETASWIQGWNNANAAVTRNHDYEEMTLEMHLGEEDKLDEFRIETTVVDDETLDLGPFKGSDIARTSQHKAAGTSTPTPGVTAAGGAVIVSSRPSSAGSKVDQVATMEMTEKEEDGYLYSSIGRSTKSKAEPGEEAVTSFLTTEPILVRL